MASIHRYQSELSWYGSTGAGYDAYDRAHEGYAPPAADRLALTADPAFRGDPNHLNPEQLVVLAASSCQLLTFLAVAARARIDVVAYEDTAEGEMPDTVRPMRITRISLRPRITIRGAVPIEKVERLVQVAHNECFIANSLNCDVDVTPTIAVTAAE